MQKPIKIGTRSSKLALWQAYYVADRLKEKGLQVEIVPFETKGDKIQNVAISKIGSKGVFTEELEDSLRNKDIDIAVHSAKDMPGSLPEDLHLIAFGPREIANDVIVSHNPDFKIKKGSIIGTSSTRRAALLKRLYPEIVRVEMRGNLQTRFRKLEEGHCEAMLLAYAGVERMGYTDKIVLKLPLDTFTPAVGQGSVAIEAAKDMNPSLYEVIRSAVNCKETEKCLLAERAFLKQLNGGCSVPVYGYAHFEGNQLHMKGGVISLDGTECIEDNLSTDGDAVALGQALASAISQRGALDLLATIKAKQSSS
ncbi:MAG: hydroxymethylbilane synthase [Cyclobacteriaceae bacterium]|nr:hydroxymethylbilane synthase [Cyclobacteriaceae bacterium]MCH8515336.1 hydroxymethylbilane synthase [Cyclobacteriaceae bacterium]